MGKTVRKNQVAKVRKTKSSGSFVVKGRKFELESADSRSIAEFLRGKGYPVGTLAKFKGGEYRLELDGMSGDHKMVRVA